MIAEKKLSPIERGKEGTHGREKKTHITSIELCIYFKRSIQLLPKKMIKG
jgi:hypothetical protein